MNLEAMLIAAACVAVALTYYFMDRRLTAALQAFNEEKQRLGMELAGATARTEALTREKAEASTDAAKFAAASAQAMGELAQIKERHAALSATNEVLLKTKDESEALAESRVRDLEKKLEDLRAEKQALSARVSADEASKQQRDKAYDEKVVILNNVLQQRQQELDRERLAKEQAEAERLRLLDETWQRHESAVEERMKLMCQRQSIDYVPKEKFPFKGKPDNCVQICGEHIVFDSKSPAGDDLANFPNYIKREAEAAKKYAVEGVKTDIYLVVPSNAIHVIKDTFLNFAKYRVHVITPDAVEPILISLKKIEEYEFAEKLSPENREKIVSVLGKFAHNMKRKVQIDQFMANETIALLMDAEKLPADILEEAQKIERSSMLNPPQERRNKMIGATDLAKEAQKLSAKGAGQEINMEVKANILKSVPLHKSPVQLELSDTADGEQA